MAPSRYVAWTLFAVALWDGPAMAEAPDGKQERFLFSEKEGEGALVWVFGGNDKHPAPFMHPSIVEDFPDSDDRSSMNRYQHAQRLWWFGYHFFVPVLASCVMIEIIVAIVRKCVGRDGYSPVNTEDRNARALSHDDSSATTMLKPGGFLQDALSELGGGHGSHSGDTGGGYSLRDVGFAVYMTTYEYFCFGVVVYALYYDLIDMDFGLDWELYLPWAAECVIMHVACTIISAVIFTSNPTCPEPVRKPRPCAVVMTSMIPFISERWNLLRDFITLGIYISQGHWVSYICAGISGFSLVVVFARCMQTPLLMLSMRQAYWPLLIDDKTEQGKALTESDLGKKVRDLMKERMKSAGIGEQQPHQLWTWALKQMDEATREHKRINTWNGDLPQGFAAVLYMMFNKFSGFVLACSLMNGCKAVMLVLLRPVALCYLAGIGEKWTNCIRSDVGKIMQSKTVKFNACDWRCLTLNALEILIKMDDHYQEANAAAIEGLGNLYEGDTDMELHAALVNFLREIMSQKTELEEPCITALLKLCKGLKAEDLKAADPGSGNLGYVPSGVAMDEARSLVRQMQEGNHDWKGLLESINCSPYAEVNGTNPDDLMICYSDLEPDDSMAIAQLWHWNFEKLKMKNEPLIIFAADFADKDHTTVFEKKVLMTQLMVGTRDFYVCTPDAEFYTREKERGENTDPKHKNAAYWQGLREQNLDAVCNKIANHQGPNLLLYIMAPGRGNVGSIVARLKKMGKWPLPKTWKVFLYSGGFNMKGMTSTDLSAIKEIAALANQQGNPLADAAKFPFFGAKEAHPVTSSFTTFALPQFAADLNMVAQPVLIALLKLLNDEHNMGLIKPDKIYRKGKDKYGKLEPYERERFAIIEKHFKEDTLQEYCAGIQNDFMLWCKVPDFKKSTIAAFASGCCDSPLCDQLIFMIEYLKVTFPEALKNTDKGKWAVNAEKGFTSVEAGTHSAGDTCATQPVLANHLDMQALNLGRHALQDYLLAHLRKFGKGARRMDGQRTDTR